MVFFTCSHCGESIKKPSVAKHYQTKCRKNEPFLTCVDCLKDFRGVEYEAHTKCVTEDERYSAKGYVPKPSQNKGERKQQAWQECIQVVLKKPTLKSDERDLISAISKYENVPRKKAKFINFLSNALRQYAKKNDLIDRVWVQMESVFKETASSNDEQNQNGKSLKEDTPTETQKADENGLKKEKKRKKQTEEENVAEISESGNTDEKVKKKKQKLNQEIEPEVDTDTLVTEEAESKQGKKNRKRKSEENGQTEADNSVLDETEPEKKKKKKKHDKQTENEINETAPVQTPETEAKTKKKNKKSKSENFENNLDEGTAEPVEDQAAVIKKEKKGKKSENKENCGEKAVVEEAQEEEEEEKTADKKKKTKKETGAEEDKQETFDWKATILNILNQDGKNNKIQLQKLQKKVLKLHCQTLNCENSQKKEKKFMKKLKNMPQIEIDNDFVVLKS